MQLKSSLLPKISILTGLAIGAFALAAFADSTWVQAPPGPPNCPSTVQGCLGPINVGVLNSGITQEKKDSLQIDGSLGVVGDFKVDLPHMGVGKVLMDANGDGKATWQTLPSGSGGGSPTVTSSASCTASVNGFGGSGGVGSCTATCPPGSQVISGAFVYNSGGNITKSSPISKSSWEFSISGSNGVTLTGTAICLGP